MVGRLQSTAGFIALTLSLGACTPLIGSRLDATIDSYDAVAFDHEEAPLCGPLPADTDSIVTLPMPLTIAYNAHFRGTFLDHSQLRYVYGGEINSARTTERGIVIRLLSNGAIDRTFGDNGYFFSPEVPTVNDLIAFYSMAEDAQGRLLIAGYEVTLNNNGHIDQEYGYVRRVDQYGTIDSGYGIGGVTEFESNTVILDVAMDGPRLVTVGADADQFAVGTRGFIAVLDDNGLLDPSFNGGAIRYDYGSQGYSAVSARRSGYFAGGTTRGIGGGRVLAVNRDGTLNAHFGTSGIATHPLVSTLGIRAMAIQSDESVLIAGADSARRPTMVRFDPRGQPDMSFGLGGSYVTYRLMWDIGYQLHSSLVLQCDDRPVLGLSDDDGAMMLRVSSDGRDEIEYDAQSLVGYGDAMLGTMLDPTTGSIISITGIGGAVTSDLGEWVLSRPQ